MLRSYSKDQYYLLKYYSLCTVIYSVAISFLIFLNPWAFQPSVWLWLAILAPVVFNSFLGLILAAALSVFCLVHFYSGQFHFWQSGIVLLGIYFGMVAVQLIHNCAHKSFRPRSINRLLGELFSIHLLSGFPGFVIIHLHHHKNPDHPELDPHPNEDLGFFQYLFSIKRKLKNHFEKLYFHHWGDQKNARLVWNMGQALLPLNRLLRVWILLLVAGPIGFTLFFIPSFISNHITFAHINYFTHSKQKDGSFEIVNMNHNFIYRFINLIMFGGYFHKNHHLDPNLFNPAHYKSEKESA